MILVESEMNCICPDCKIIFFLQTIFIKIKALFSILIEGES